MSGIGELKNLLVRRIKRIGKDPGNAGIGDRSLDRDLIPVETDHCRSEQHRDKAFDGNSGIANFFALLERPVRLS